MTKNTVQEKNVHDEIEMSMIKMVNAHADARKKERELIRKGHVQAVQNMKNKKNRRKNMVAKVFSVSVFIICLLFLVWVMASWINVASNNTDPELVKNIWDFNFFKVFFS